MELDALWLRTLQAACGRATHEIRGALNGVAINLEVVRSRADREGAPASDVRRYASSAIDQLGSVIAMTEAMLGLARAGREPADVAQVGRQLVALLEPVARSNGGTLVFAIDPGAVETTSAQVTAVRLVIGAVLLAVTEGTIDVTCWLRSGPSCLVEVSPAPLDGALLRDVLDALAGSGIRVETAGHGISIAFPAGQ